MYARTDMGGAYRYNKETQSWESITDFIGGDDWNLNGAESIATDPIEPNRVYMALGTYSNSNGAILYSYDYGDNWTRVDLPFGNGANEVGRSTGERLMVDPNDNSIIYFATRNSGLYVSKDYGQSWNPVESFPTEGGYMEEGYNIGLTWVAFDKSSSETGEATKTIFVGVPRTDDSATVYRSDDAGETWTEVANPVCAQRPNQSFKPLRGAVMNGYLYVTYSNKVGPNGLTYGALQKYDIAAGTWEEITPIDIYCGICGLSVDETNNLLVVSTLDLWADPQDNVMISKDGGETWEGFWDPETQEKNYELDISFSPWLDWNGTPKVGWWISGVAINPFNPDEVYYGTGATIFKTTNFTKADTEKVKIEVAVKGLEENAIFDFVSPKGDGAPALYSIMGDLDGFKHQDVDTAPESLFGELKCTSIDTAALDYNIVVRTASNDDKRIFYSTDAAETWQAVSSLPEDTEASGGGQAVLSADGKVLLWAPAGAGKGVYRTEDWGKTWTLCEGLSSSSSMLEADKMNPDVIYAANDGVFYKSTDAGKTFTKLADILVTSFDMDACPDTEGDIWLALGSGGVYYLNGNDGTLTRISDSVTQADAIGLGKAKNDGDYMALYILGEANGDGYGVYQSLDKGVTWTRINDDTEKWGNVNKNISGDPKVYGRVYVSTNGRGIIMGNVAE